MIKTKMLKKFENYFERSKNTVMGWVTFLCVIQIKGLLALLLILSQS